MKNPVLPYLVIAVIGVLLVMGVSYVGIGQRDAIQNDDDNNTEENANENNDNEGAADDPEAIFEDNCASCHGNDLEGGAGPDLTEVGGRYSADEIEDIITNGKGDSMPAGLIDGDEKEAVVEWLSDME
ncbi:MAG TPA: cytochrome c [Virgibacillus sp.]|nr:cytochrome c [Virgibacillus sp.]